MPGVASSRNSTGAAAAAAFAEPSTNPFAANSSNRPMSLSLGKGSSLKKLDFANLQRVKVLGLGSFGRVELVRYRDAPEEPQQLFALKIQQKANIFASRQTKASMRERLLLEQCDHPFICRLHATFADQHLLYMLLECVRGGELFQLLSVQPGRRVPFAPARFYAACVIDALSYMHEVPRRIMYRDIKPENLLVDHMGYLKIVDFGFAKRLTEETAFRTYTFCGTPDYIAPEMLSGNGYDQGVDVWAVGVLIYEMIFGYAPFGEVPAELKAAAAAVAAAAAPATPASPAAASMAGPQEQGGAANDFERASGDFAATIMRPPERHTPQVTMKGIMFDDVAFPPEPVLPINGDNGTASRDIVLSLLVKRPEHRLGCARPGGIRNAYRHEWFEGFDFRAMRERRMPSPWKPELDGEREVVEPAENYAWDFPIKTFTGDHSWCEGW